MIFPNFNPFGFAKVSPRARMIQQLQGRGLGSFGLMEVISAGRGHVGVLSATSQLDIAQGDARAAMLPAASLPVEARLTMQEPVASRGVTETRPAQKVIDSQQMSVEVKQTEEDSSVPDYGLYAQGNKVSPENVEAYPEYAPDEATPWETAPHGEPLYLPGENEGAPGLPPALAPPAVSVAAQTGASTGGIPWWVWALGAGAVGFGLYKFGSKKR